MVNISHINACSIINKVSQFQLEICDKNTDICAITETWIKQDDVDTVTKEVPPQGYKTLSRSRSGGKTGESSTGVQGPLLCEGTGLN